MITDFYCARINADDKGLEFIDSLDGFLAVYFIETLIQNIPKHTACFFITNMFNYGPMHS